MFSFSVSCIFTDRTRMAVTGLTLSVFKVIWLVQAFQLLKLLAAMVKLAWNCIQHRVEFWWDKEKKKKLIEYMNEAAHMKETLLSVEDWQDTLFTWPMFKQECKMLYLDMYKDVHLHGPAKDVQLSRLDGTSCKLFDFARDGRPLVVNFGSCS